MKDGNLIKYGLLSLGSLLVALSFTAAGKYAVIGRTDYVVLAYLTFVAGYKTCWYGVHQEGSLARLHEALAESFYEGVRYLRRDPLDYLLIALGVYSAAFGTVAFVQLIQSPSISKGLIAGVTGFGGYVLAHEGVNEVPI